MMNLKMDFETQCSPFTTKMKDHALKLIYTNDCQKYASHLSHWIGALGFFFGSVRDLCPFEPKAHHKGWEL